MPVHSGGDYAQSDGRLERSRKVLIVINLQYAIEL